jgi:hypothetical protein
MTPYRDHAGRISRRTDRHLGWLFGLCFTIGFLGAATGLIFRKIVLDMVQQDRDAQCEEFKWMNRAGR